MQYGQAPALVADVVGPQSSLFAPAKPALIPVEGVLVGCIDVAALVGAPRAVALVQRLLRCLHMIHTRKTPPLQLVYVHEFRSPRARVVVDLVVGLGVEVRALEPSDATILVEVRRPEGFMIVGLTGCKLALPGAADVRVRTLNEQKDRAEVGGSVLAQPVRDKPRPGVSRSRARTPDHEQEDTTSPHA